jgi:hypothetical protein
MPALFLGTDKIKRRTMRGRAFSSLHFNDLHFRVGRHASKSVIAETRGATKSVRARPAGSWKNVKRVAWLLLAATVCGPGAGCSKAKHSEHATQARSPEPAPPTPDTTPVAVLRTPAGLVLGIEGTPAPSVPTPGTTGAVPQTTTTPGP